MQYLRIPIKEEQGGQPEEDTGVEDYHEAVSDGEACGYEDSTKRCSLCRLGVQVNQPPEIHQLNRQ